MKYLLDTNACAAIINGKPETVRRRIHDEILRGAEICVSSITVFELWYGIAKSARRNFNLQRVEEFLSGHLELLSFDPEDARYAGEIRAHLEGQGKPIGAYDELLAGQAIRYGLILVTANVREFSRVVGLKLETWT